MISRFSKILVAASLAAVACAQAASAQTLTTVTFDQSTDVGLFAQRQTNNNGAPATDPYIYNAAAGTGTTASGAATFTTDTNSTANDTSAIYTASSYNFNTLGTPITLSLDFHTPATAAAFGTAGPAAQIGYSIGTTTTFGGVAGNAFLGGRLQRTAANTYTIQTQTKGTTAGTTATTASATGTLTLATGTWYRLTLDLTKTANASDFTVSVNLYSLGADGTATPTLLTDATTGINGSTVSNAALFTDPDVFPGFRAAAGNNNIAFDNFSFGAVPEPGTWVMAVAGAVVLFGVSRRLRRC